MCPFCSLVYNMTPKIGLLVCLYCRFAPGNACLDLKNKIACSAVKDIALQHVGNVLSYRVTGEHTGEDPPAHCAGGDGCLHFKIVHHTSEVCNVTL